VRPALLSLLSLLVLPLAHELTLCLFRNSYMMMSDEWFDEYVYQVVADRKFISKKLVEVFDKADATVLPPWVRLISFRSLSPSPAS